MAPTPDGNGPRPPLDVSGSTTEVTPGQPTLITATVRNPGPGTVAFSLTVVGLQQEWVSPPPASSVLAPGESREVGLEVTLPYGFPPCALAAALHVQAIDPTGGGPVGAPARADITVVVGDGSTIGATLEPPEVRRGRFHVALNNRGSAAVRLELTATSPTNGVVVRFDQPSIVLGAGQSTRVRARMRAPRPFSGRERRQPFEVRVQGRATPVLLDGAVVQRPLLSGWVIKAVAIVAIVGLWATVVAFGIGRLGSSVHKEAASKANSAMPLPPSTPTGEAGVAPSTVAPTTVPPGTVAPGTPAGGKAAAASSGGSSGSTGTAKGTAGTAKGTAGAPIPASSSEQVPATPAAGGQTGDSGSGFAAAGTSPSAVAVTRVSGRVTAPDPSNVTVVITPTSLVDEAALAGDTPALASQLGPVGKVYGNRSISLTAQVVVPSETTTTTPDGSWAFAGVKAPGYYLVTFAKAGYAASKQVVTTTTAGVPVLVSATLEPGSGTMAGVVFGPHGPLGGVDITITDGTVSLVTRTPTVGAVGTWQVTGLSAPASYLVTATEPGYATETTLVTLAPAGIQTGVDLTMRAGLGTITGLVSSATGGVGGVTVTATTGPSTLSVTTSTVSPVGSFTLPDLPLGVYTVTVSGAGWQSQTQQVVLNTNATVNFGLVATTGTVGGQVLDSSTQQGLSDAGIVLANADTSFKTLSQSPGNPDSPPGSFSFSQVPPGQYVLTISRWQYSTATVAVTVRAGQVSSPCVGTACTLTPASPESLDTATISGHVQDLFTGQPLTTAANGVAFVVDGNPAPDAQANSNGDFTITKLGPGIHRIAVSAPGYQTVIVSAAVALGGAVVTAPTALLPKLDTMFGKVTSNAGGGPVAGTTIAIVNGDGTVAGSAISGSDGTYRIPDIVSGIYQLVVTPPPGFVTPPPRAITFLLATDQSVDIPLDRLPAYSVSVLTPGSGGTLSPLSGAAVALVDLTRPGVPACNPLVQTTASVALLFEALCQGDTYRATASPPGGSGLVPSTATFVGVLNQTTNQVLVLTAPATAPAGTVTYTLGDQPGTPVPDSSRTTVSMTGAIGFDTAGNRTVRTFATGTANGAFAFNVQGAVLPPTADFFVTSTGFTSFSAPGTPIGVGALNFNLTPIPVPVNGSLTLLPAGDNPATTAVAVTYQDGAPAPVNVAVAGNGALTWTDSRVGTPGLALPATYVVTFSRPGYDTTASTFAVGLCTVVCSSTLTATLNKHASISANAATSAGVPVNGATFTLRNNNVVVATVTAPANASAVNFGDLGLVNANYTVTAVAPGFAVPGPLVTAGVAPGQQTTATVVLDQLARITGRVTGTVTGSAPTSLARVTVRAVGPGGPGGTQTTTFSTTTAADGSYTLLGDATSNGQGLFPGVYTVTLSTLPAGWQDPGPTTVTTSAGVAVTQDFGLAALNVTISGVVTDSQGKALPGVAVTAVSPVLNPSTVRTTTGANGSYTLGNLTPVQYTLSFTLTGYSPLSGIVVNLQVGTTAVTLNESLVAFVDTVTGRTFTQGRAGPVALPGVSVQVEDPTTRAVIAQGTSVDDGHGNAVYSVTGFPDGSYLIAFSATGYTPGSANQGFTGGQTVAIDQTLAAIPLSLTVTVNSAVGPTPLVGAAVTLTPTGPTGTSQGPQATVAGGTTTFNQVLPGAYTVSADGSGVSPAHRTGTANVTIAPSNGGTAPPVTVTIAESEISGTASFADNLGTHPSDLVIVSIFAGTTTTGQPIANPPVAANGTYSAFLAPGPYTVRFNRDATFTTVQSTVTTANGVNTTVNGTVGQEATFSVTVQTATGTAVTNATVTLAGGPTAGQLTAANSGTLYTFTVLPGAYTVNVTAPPALTGSGTQTIPPGTPTALTVVVK